MTSEADRMDALVTRPEADRVSPPSAAGGNGAGPDTTIIDPAEHNVVFSNLVTGDKDLVGLVAYSIYKQNKYDWLLAFSRQLGRMPNEAEAQSYLLGESTPRRLATYRHLAEATIEGRGIEARADAAPGPRPSSNARPTPLARGAPQPFGLTHPAVLGLVIVLAIIAAMLWFTHAGSPTKP